MFCEGMHIAAIPNRGARPGAKPGEATFTLATTPNPKQKQTLDLIAAIRV